MCEYAFKAKVFHPPLCVYVEAVGPPLLEGKLNTSARREE